MKKYRIWAKSVSFPYLDVVANSYEEAREIAEDTDGGEFEPNEQSGDWEITDVIEIDDEEEQKELSIMKQFIKTFCPEVEEKTLKDFTRDECKSAIQEIIKDI